MFGSQFNDGSPATHADTSLKARLRSRLPLLILAAAVLAVYLPSVRHDFIPLFDDTRYILCNPAVQGFTLSNIHAAFSGFYCGNYAPLHMISYMFDHMLWGLNPSGYILTNILLHTATGLMLYCLLVRSSLPVAAAFAGSFVFLLHPVQVEAVVWASERKTVLCMLFILAAWHLYLDFRSRGGRLQYLLSIALFAASILAKSVAVIFPLVLLCHESMHDNERKRVRNRLQLIPFFLFAAAGACLTIYSQDPAMNGGRTGYHGGSPLATFYTMLPVLLRYVRMLLYPAGLTAIYGDVEVKTSFDEDVFLAGAGVLMLAAVGVLLHRHDRQAWRWYVIFFTGLLPVSQILPIVTLINDRYLYFPMIGVAGLCAAAAARANESSFMVRKWLFAGCVALFALLSWLTFQQSKTWKNTYSLYRQIVRHNSAKFYPLILQDMYLLQSSDKALLELAEALLVKFPSSPEVLRFSARINLRANRFYKARQDLEQLIVRAPSDIESRTMLVEVYEKTGWPDEAHK